MNIAVFVSGRGSNLKAIINSNVLNKTGSKIKAVFSDKLECPAFQIAKENSIKTFCIGKAENSISIESLSDFLIQLEIELIVLAGYLKLIPKDLIKKFHSKIINIHPALLPSFGGKGMYGINVHKAVFNSSAKVSGATVHFVDETFDTGKIIAQKCVDINNVKSPEEIAEKVLIAEHQLLPFVVGKFAENKIKIVNERVVIED